MDSVPDHILRLLEDVQSSVEEVEEKYNLVKRELSSKGENLTSALLMIKELRESLVNIDVRLADCQSIAQGFQRAQVEGESAFDPPQSQLADFSQQSEDPQTDQMIKEMEKKTEEKMSELKKTFSQFSSALNNAQTPSTMTNMTNPMMMDPAEAQSAIIMQKAAAAKKSKNDKKE